MIWRTRLSSLAVSTRPQNETVFSKCLALLRRLPASGAVQSRVEHPGTKVQRNLPRPLYGANGQSPGSFGPQRKIKLAAYPVHGEPTSRRGAGFRRAATVDYRTVAVSDCHGFASSKRLQTAASGTICMTATFGPVNALAERCNKLDALSHLANVLRCASACFNSVSTLYLPKHRPPWHDARSPPRPCRCEPKV